MRDMGFFVASKLEMFVWKLEEELEHFLARTVLRVWMVVLLVLASSYTTSFAAMLTVHQLSPTVTDVHELQKN